MRKITIFLSFILLTFAGVISAQENEVYTVQRGDSLTSIANAFDVEIDAILLANNIIDPNRLRVGQQLVIPTVAVAVPRRHTVLAGETLNDIAIRYNTTVQALIATNNLTSSTLARGQVLRLPAIGGAANYARTYRVDIGDTLRSIGERFGVTWQQIAAYNNIPNPNYVEAGLLITIPPVGYVIPTPAPVTPTPVVVTQTPVAVRYIVQAGDTLNGIADRFSVTLESLRAYNNLAVGAAIFPNDALLIPPTGGVTTPVVTTPRTAVNGYYTVRVGDTMFAIASSFNLNVYALAQANGILNLNSIYTGQALRIPS